ncbi:MAG: hypothetical protein LBV19_04440 [Streptococcaceae bacterium]|jgi:hypothetical protein|nr:hypothetical protein [Streptococcaceae bacterium]
MIKKQDFANVSAFDSAFDSEIFFESQLSLSENEALSELGEKEASSSSTASTASQFDFEIFSESGKILRDFQMTLMEEQFPDISFVEEKMNFKSDSSEMTEEEKISEFAFHLLHSNY